MSSQNAAPDRAGKPPEQEHSDNVSDVPAQINRLNRQCDSPKLDRIQRWMFNVIAHPQGVRRALHSPSAQKLFKITENQLSDIVLPSIGLSSADRLQIYSNSYTWRLVEVLEGEFPTILATLGEDPFYHLAKKYIDQYPSQHYSLQYLGVRFAKFLNDEKELENHLLLADVATVERSIEDVFSAPQSTHVSNEEFLSIAPERWPDIAFKLIPALALHELSHPINKFINNVAKDSAAARPGSQQTFVLVYRKNFTSWRVTISREQFMILQAFKRGLTLGQALEHCLKLPGFNFEEFVDKLSPTFREWTAEGIFSELIYSSDSSIES